MSVDILSNLSKEVVSKKGVVTDSKVETPAKKEGSSLFDSLMKDIQKDKQTTPTENKKTTEKSESKESKADQTKTKEGNLEASKKVTDGLVDLVVDKAKDKSKKEISSTKNVETTEKATESKSNEDIKLKVDANAKIIKEAVEDIKSEISKVGKEDVDTSKETKKTIDSKGEEKTTEKPTQSKNNEDIKSKVDANAKIIKEAVEDIKSEISKVGKEDVDTSKETKKTIDSKSEEKTTEKATESKNNEDIKSKVDANAKIIKEAVEDIKSEISKVENTQENGVFTGNTKNTNEGSIKENSKGILNQNQYLVNDKVSKDDSSIDGKTTLLANGFLNSQQKNKQTVSLTQVSNARENIEKNKTVKSVKDSANMLDLNIEKVDVEHSDKSGKVEKIDILSKQDKESQLQMIQNRGLSRFLMEKDTMINNEQLIKNAELEKVSSIDSQVQKEKNVMLNVPQTVVETIQSKIIGAQQKVGSFMSEVARNMYLNYKPPFTSFRMNLNPANLGSIAVVMRASKTDNSISVSMNMNNNSTMEVFAENKTALQTALQKQLGEGSNVTLNFDMQDSSTGEQFGQSSQNNNSNGQNNTSNTSEEPTNTIIEEENTEELDYM